MSPMEKKRVSNLPRLVFRTLEIIEMLADAKTPIGITELSRKLKLNKSSIYRIVEVLRQKGYVRQDDETSKYYLGCAVLGIAGKVLDRVSLRDTARKYLESLSAETSHTAQLAILDGKEVLFIDQVEGNDVLRLQVQIGLRAPLYCTAAGKCILAFVKEDEVEAILNDCNFEALTPRTISSFKDLTVQLKKIKKIGYSFCDGEYHNGIRAVGAPIIAMNGKAVGAIVLTIPSIDSDYKNVSYYGKLVREVANKTSNEIGFGDLVKRH